MANSVNGGAKLLRGIRLLSGDGEQLTLFSQCGCYLQHVDVRYCHAARYVMGYDRVDLARTPFVLDADPALLAKFRHGAVPGGIVVFSESFKAGGPKRTDFTC